MFIDCVVKPFQATGGQFTLTHPDYDIQNSIVPSEGKPVGIIGWDGVAARPKCLGSKRYPRWLTLDWDPGMYRYRSNGITIFLDIQEDSPETLARYHTVYREVMERLLGGQDGVPASDDLRSGIHETNTTLLPENLDIAATDMEPYSILKKIIKRIDAATPIPGGYTLEFLYMDLCNDFGEDFVQLRTRDALRSDFEQLV